MKLSIKLPAVFACCLCAVSAAHAEAWYSTDSALKCVDQGSPADRVRALAAQGIPAQVRGKGDREGIVAVSYHQSNGQRAGDFFYPTKAECEKMVGIIAPVDSKYE